jgi:anti-anti-sigma regulatory factor
MTTAAIAEFVKVDQASLVSTLEKTGKNLESGEGKAVVDFSSVEWLDSAAVQALEKFADVADGKGAQVALRGVNVGVYKVLKLAKLTSRFSFAA